MLTRFRRNTYLDYLNYRVSYNHLIFVDIWNNSISINFEMSPSQKSFPLQDAEMVGSPLLGPFPLETEGVVPPLGSGGGAGTNHIKSSQQSLCLSAYCTDGQRLPEEGGGQRNLCLRRPQLAPSALLGSSIPDSRLSQVVDEGMKVIRGFPEGADHDATNFPKCDQLPLYRTNFTNICATVSLVSWTTWSKLSTSMGLLDD